jgi:alpha-ketoglutarate-dependent taurine dioxygenase
MNKLKTSFLNDDKLPLVIEPKDQNTTLEELLKILNDENKFFKDSMLKYGGLLFRNFPTPSVDEFIAVMKALNTGPFVDYIGGGSPRKKIKEGVYTSTEAPPAIKIHLHNEMSFAENYPSHIYFFCETPPEENGETFIGDARKILQSVDSKLKDKLAEKNLKYISRYYYKSQFMDLMNKIQRGHKTWIDVFETDQKRVVEEQCRTNKISYKWHKNDWLEICRIRPPFKVHPITKENVWFNQVHLFNYNPRFIGWWRYIAMRLFYCRKDTLVDEARFADDKKISLKEIYHILDVLDKHSVYFPWQKGDIMALDNILTMHGRAPFKGKRRILTAMTNEKRN